MPGDLPKDVQFTAKASNSLFDSKKKGLANIGLGDLFGRFISWDAFEDFQKTFNTSLMGPFPPSTGKWQDDVWYGSQFLNGCNPEVIQRCRALPEKFPVTDELIGNQLDRGYTLQKAMEEGYIYMVDYEMLDGIPTFEKDDKIRHIAASMGLFFVRNSGQLVPIAIQLHQIPGEGNPIWTPNDKKFDWLNAKLWLRAADTQYHQDDEIQNWAKDVSENGYPAKSSGSVDKGFPSSFSAREELIHFLTMAIFISSCQHAAVNFSQKDVYGFHPNSPSLMRQPAPCKKGESCLRKTMDTLASQHHASLMVFIVNELTTIYPDEKFLGDYDEFLFTEAEVTQAAADFKTELESIEAKINERNCKLEVPYEYLRPSRIPNSIAI